MPELRVPVRPDNAFEAYFRRLIRDSLVRSAEAEYDFHRRSGHGLRARRAAHVVTRAQALQQEPPTAGLPRFGPGLLVATGIAWIACGVVLAWVAVMFGVRSWVTGAADLALIVLTFAWFVVAWGSDIRLR